MTAKIPRLRKSIKLAAVAVALTAQLLFLLLVFGPSLPFLTMLSNGAHLLPLVGGGALIVLVMMCRRMQVLKWVVASALFWLASCAWLTVNRSNAWTAPPAAKGHATSPIRIISFNTWLALKDPEAAARWIMTQNADVVILMEVGWRSRVLLTQLALHYPYVVTCRGSRVCSTVILSRRMPTEMRGLAKGDADNRRALSAAMMRFPDFTLVAVHLSQPWPMARQPKELGLMRDALRDIPRQHLVVAGDFNATGWSVTMRDAASLLQLKMVAPDKAPSWPAPASELPLPTLFDIDHVLLGTGWRAAQMERGPALGSDHYPYVITLGR